MTQPDVAEPLGGHPELPAEVWRCASTWTGRW
jgi:hypothetical protein